MYHYVEKKLIYQSQIQGIRTQIVISNAPLRERRMDISDVKEIQTNVYSHTAI